MPVLTKVFKPSTLRVDAFRLEFLSAMRKAGNVIKKEDFGAITKEWDHKPEIEVDVSLSPRGPQLLVDSSDKILNRLNKGTKPHDIWAGYYTGKSEHKVLAFASKSTPKTTPGVIGSKAGSTGPVDSFRPYVRHPGTEERGWDKAIVKKRAPWFKRRMVDALKIAKQKSGHSLP